MVDPAISLNAWENYKEIMDIAHETFDKDIITWIKPTRVIPQYFEDNQTSGDTRINLECLVDYDTFRTSPVAIEESAGKLDYQNIVLYLNCRYLDSLGYLNDKGYLDFNPDSDRFLHRGILYECKGAIWLHAAQILR